MRKEFFQRDIVILHQLLTESEIIPKNTDFKKFTLAFSAKPLQEPLKIKWIVTGKNQQTSKSSLFHFISQLEDHKLIDNTEWKDKNYRPLYDKIAAIFADQDGNLFSVDGLKSSRSQGVNSDCAMQSEINNLVKKVAQVKTDINSQ